MPTDLLTQLRAAVEGTTPGEWTAKDWRVGSNVHDPATFKYVLDTAYNKATRNEVNRANARFIATVQRLMPQIIAALEEAARMREALEKELAWQEELADEAARAGNAMSDARALASHDCVRSIRDALAQEAMK